MVRRNPIGQRLETLCEQWAEFAIDELARVLCWSFEADELRMADAFLAAEADERAGQHPDVFITLETSFANPHAHGFDLYEALKAGYEASRDALQADGVDTSWELAAHGPQPRDDVGFLIERCRAFIAHYQLTRHLVLVLRPRAVADAAAYQVWLQRFVRGAPSNLRLLAIDHAETPSYASLAAAEPRRVRVQPAALDMAGALDDISRDAGNLDSPGGQFRHLFVKLGNALKKNDLPLALQLGNSALGIASTHGWWHVAVPVHVLLAAGLTGAERFQEALAQYTAAEKSAARGETEGAEEARAACRTLRFQSRLGAGSTLIAARAWKMAAQLYEEAAPLAAELGDPRGLLDCHRLASFCHEQAGDPERAFTSGTEGLRVAKQMDKETLQSSTFAYLGESLMRLTTTQSSLRSLEVQTEREIVAIAGTRDWRTKAPDSSAAHAGTPTAVPA